MPKVSSRPLWRFWAMNWLRLSCSDGSCDRSVETSIVLDAGWTGRGLGRRLYGALLDQLASAGTHRAYAVVTLPNDASVALHHRLGFRDVGVEDESGWKLGRYWSTLTLEKRFEDA